MTASDMNIVSALDIFNYGLVLLYGLVLDVAIAGGCETAKQRRVILWLCPAFLLIQLLGWLVLGESGVKQIYPIIVHLPLALILVTVLKRSWGVAIVSTCTAYLCCQPPRWGSIAIEALTHSAVAADIVYILLIAGMFWLLRRYFVAAAYSTMTYSRWALLLFGSLPCTYYIFDYATTVYSDALYSGIQALNEFLPTVLITFYILFLPAFYIETQKRSSAEMQRSLLEVELKQSQQEMDAMRASEMQTAVYQHDMRHHLNMIGGLLAAGQPQRVLPQPILHLVPDGRRPQGLLHDLVQLGPVPHAVGAGPVGHIVVNAHGERIGLLEHHAHLPPQLVDIHIRREDVLSVVAHRTLDAHAGHQIVHPIQRLEERGLAAAGRPDQGGDALFRDVHAHMVQRLRTAVPQIQPHHRDDITHRLLRFLKYRPVRDAARSMSSASAIRMAAMAKATSNSPCSLA